MYVEHSAATARSRLYLAPLMLAPLMLAVLLGGCATGRDATGREADIRFFDRMRTLCGSAFAGRIVSTDAADADMRGKPLVMHVRACSADEVRIPFHVGDDRSRTWVLRPQRIILTGARSRSGQQTGFWLQLKHDHRHADGTPDMLTNYGGESLTGGKRGRLEFPADDESKALFAAKGNPASIANVWAMEITPRIFAYELRRPGRFFRVEFDLGKPVAAPPPPWGAR